MELLDQSGHAAMESTFFTRWQASPHYLRGIDRKLDTLKNSFLIDATDQAVLDVHCSARWPNDPEVGPKLAARNMGQLKSLITGKKIRFVRIKVSSLQERRSNAYQAPGLPADRSSSERPAGRGSIQSTIIVGICEPRRQVLHPQFSGFQDLVPTISTYRAGSQYSQYQGVYTTLNPTSIAVPTQPIRIVFYYCPCCAPNHSSHWLWISPRLQGNSSRVTTRS